MSDAQWLERARRVTPGGSQTNSRQHGKVGPVSYPAFAQSGNGTFLHFRDGARAVDLAGANGAIALGYAHPDVVRSLERFYLRGSTLSLPTVLEVEASEAMLELQGDELAVRWVRTGSEAVTAAVCIAMEATGREQVVGFAGAYHGWHSWARRLQRCENISKVESVLCSGRTAALVVESPRWHEVDGEYIAMLREARRLCSRYGTLLVFDDVVYGFRFAVGGLAETSGVRSDLSCFSKALGNGVPVGCVVGVRDLMMRAGAAVSSTFGGETLGLAAALAVLRVHAKRDVPTALRDIGTRLRAALDDGLKASPLRVEGTPQHFRFVADRPEQLEQVLDVCMRNPSSERVLVHRDANNVNLQMTDDVVASVVKTVCDAVRGL